MPKHKIFEKKKKPKAQTQGPKTENGVKPYTKPIISNYFGQFH